MNYVYIGRISTIKVSRVVGSVGPSTKWIGLDCFASRSRVRSMWGSNCRESVGDYLGTGCWKLEITGSGV